MYRKDENDEILNILSFCYDRADKINKNLYVASKGNELYILDSIGEVLKKVKHLDNFKYYEWTNKAIYLVGNKTIKIDITSNKFKETTDRHIDNIQRVTDTQLIVELSDLNNYAKDSQRRTIFGLYTGIGVMDNDEHEVLPCVYSRMKYRKSTSDRVIYSVNVFTAYSNIRGYAVASTTGKVIAEFVNESEDELAPGIRLAYNIDKVYGKPSSVSLYSEYTGKILGDAYSDITRPSYLSTTNYAITLKIDKQSRKRTVGIIDLDGTEIIPTIYNKIDYIANNIFAKYNSKNKLSINWYDKEVVPPGIIDSTKISDGIPFTLGIKDNSYWFIGNDGKLYSRVRDAFPTYKNKNTAELLINLYGKWIIAREDLKSAKLLDMGSYKAEDWVKLA